MPCVNPQRKEPSGPLFSIGLFPSSPAFLPNFSRPPPSPSSSHPFFETHNLQDTRYRNHVCSCLLRHCQAGQRCMLILTSPTSSLPVFCLGSSGRNHITTLGGLFLLFWISDQGVECSIALRFQLLQFLKLRRLLYQQHYYL